MPHERVVVGKLEAGFCEQSNGCLGSVSGRVTRRAGHVTDDEACADDSLIAKVAENDVEKHTADSLALELVRDDEMPQMRPDATVHQVGNTNHFVVDHSDEDVRWCSADHFSARLSTVFRPHLPDSLKDQRVNRCAIAQFIGIVGPDLQQLVVKLRERPLVNEHWRSSFLVAKHQKLNVHTLAELYGPVKEVRTQDCSHQRITHTGFFFFTIQAIMKLMTILGIETSCDETAAAVLDVGRGRVVVRSHVIASQALTHAQYGGVVPEVAAREHVLAIIPTIDAALKTARLKPAKLNRLAVTSGPGLLTALLVGVETAKALALGWKKPLVAVNHIEGHIASSFLPLNGQAAKLPDMKFPALALIVSGGHTELILVKKMGSYKLVGTTRDDAAGEAFDKVATLLGLSYPGGPAISRASKNGDPHTYDFPRPMITSKDFDFSFSGLKTAVLYQVKGRRPAKRDVPNIAASFEQAVVDVLVAKTLRAARALKVKSLLLGGGVAANARLRTTLERETKTIPGLKYFQPNLAFATDNAAMIAMAAVFHKKANAPTEVVADSRWELV